MNDWWPHTCRVPGDGATVLPSRVLYPTEHPSVLFTGHDGAWGFQHTRQRFVVYEETPQARATTAWVLLAARVACRCWRGRG